MFLAIVLSTIKKKICCLSHWFLCLVLQSIFITSTPDRIFTRGDFIESYDVPSDIWKIKEKFGVLIKVLLPMISSREYSHELPFTGALGARDTGAVAQ
jgi:hypothetical protein